MKTTEFKNLINNVTEELKGYTDLKECKAAEKKYGAIANLTQTQYETLMARIADKYLDIQSKKGGKQMPNVEEVKTEVVETKPEVLTGEVVPAVDAKTVKTVEAAIDRVSKKLVTISNGYLSIVGDVAHLYDLKAWEVTKHNNIYEMCENKFDGMARGTVNNLLSIFKRFGDKETYKLTAEAFNEDGSPRSVRSLLEQIKTEKKALKAEKNGGAIGDGEGNGEGNDGEDTKKKAETLANISFDIIGGEWDAEAIAEELKKAIEKAQADLSQDCTITLTITRQ